MEKTTYQIEATDTFGGEANYSWVKRFTVESRSFRGAIRAAKIALGISHIKHTKTMACGDMERIDLNGCCQCVFISWAN